MDVILGLGIALPVVTAGGISVVTGVAEGVHHQKLQNEEAKNETRMAKFNIEVFCDGKGRDAKQLDGGLVVLRDDKAWVSVGKEEVHDAAGAFAELVPTGAETGRHAATAFYLAYPSEFQPHPRGLVSTISKDPPMLNWLYVHGDTGEVRYGNRTQSLEHIVGNWDWTEEDDEGKGGAGVTLCGWEGFVAVEEPDAVVPYLTEDNQVRGRMRKGGWALYFDKDDDELRALRSSKTADGSKAKLAGRKLFQVSLERRILPEEKQGKGQDEEKDKKTNSNVSGGIKAVREK